LDHFVRYDIQTSINKVFKNCPSFQNYTNIMSKQLIYLCICCYQ